MVVLPAAYSASSVSCAQFNTCQHSVWMLSATPGLKNLWHTAKNGTWKDFLGTRHFTAVPILYFFCPTSVSILWRICAYTHTHTHTHTPYCVQTVYELPLLPNGTASETCLRKLGAVRSVHWIGVQAWRWLGEYLTVDKTFYNLFLTLRRLMSYIYGAPILDVSRSHTTTQHSR